MKTVMLVFGTRPEAIKMAPLVKEFQKHPEEFKTVVCVTGQHREMLDQVLRIFEITPDYDFEAHKKLVPMQPGDVPTTYADATALERDFGFTPKITLREGLRKFAEWYKEYYY